MAYNPFMGSAGEFKSVVVAADLTIPTPVATGSPVARNGITKWERTPNIQSEGMIHFECPSTPTGLLATQQLQGGTVLYTVNVNGYFDGDSGNDTGISFAEGAFIYMNLLLNKYSAQGYYHVYGKVVSGPTYGSAAEGRADQFTCSVAVHGLWPSLTTS